MQFFSQNKSAFQPNVQVCIGIIFSLGVVAGVALLLGALIVAAYLLNVAVGAVAELASHITSVYSRSDSLMQFFMLFLLFYGVFHVGRSVLRPFVKGGAK
jgi:hypothetical protein